MGPRSHERGNYLKVVTGDAVYAMLQWGRVLMNAETWFLMRITWWSWTCFNGAAFS